jgi:hypothetical protein
MITGFVPPQSATSQQDLQISALTNQESLNPGSVGDAAIQTAVDTSISAAQSFVLGNNLKSGDVAPGDLMSVPLSAKNSFVDEAKKATGNVAVIQAASDKEKKEKEFKAMILIGVVVYFGYKYFIKGMK